jgi:acyl-CoA dehydrogenase
MPLFELNEPKVLDEDHRMIRAQVRRFVDERIVPFGDAWEAAGEIPRALFRDFGALGFLGMRHPVEYGGGGLGRWRRWCWAKNCRARPTAAWPAR